MYDIIVIGAGPAGLAAASTAAQEGLHVLVIDEYMKPGGRLLGQLYQEPNGNWWNGLEESAKLNEQAENAGVKIILQTVVYDIERQDSSWTIYTENIVYTSKQLLLATGAAESPVPLPGWTLPGVMSVGAAQVMTNVHRVKPGDKGMVIGVNVLSAAIAMELQLAGIDVVAMALPPLNQLTHQHSRPKEVMEALLHVSHLAPSKLLRIGSKFMTNHFMRQLSIRFYPKSGVSLWGIPIQLRKAVTEIYGTNQVEGVIISTIDTNGNPVLGSEERIACDFVCIAGGLYPLAELAGVANCPFYYVDELGGYVPIHNEKMETPIEGLYVAGNITGIEGAKIAISQGVVAGYSMAIASRKQGLVEKLQDSIKKVHETRKQAAIRFHPKVDIGRNIIHKQWETRQAQMVQL
ncbi:NAD(P)/FAD-dependent oxidoreductase [Virgibacillus pantothenticus]|uniref:Sarcosine oxidase subunit alpha n=1 Tax=Virgibacillus pantothenticus TaxID=1473 RepID=A0A0L0QU88_VIRPA|nr:FAD-dependent oxidoreductase [Virgibacillus pantothenticus]KNE22067.1 sarcosine oxidase subunit alpha [Virgibacillus pantothenticus]MED3737554.1 FAD-dependent oxidoreductase [Virgibacillus pantothenticus]QTY17306.1 FAD-dependent oxidoreductase [Virgibacillus pantothenticus]SIS93601.1 sarcosine oxidase subunit alpha [Virgibacillus pantothenticus]